MRGVLRRTGRDRMGLDQCVSQRDRLVGCIEDDQGFQRRKPIPRHLWVSVSGFFKDECGNYQFEPLLGIAPPIPRHDLIS